MTSQGGSIFVVIAFLGFISTAAFAQVQCYDDAVWRNIQDLSQLIHKTADYFEGGPRVRVDGLPQADQKRFAASGTITCKGREGNGSGQITRAKDVLTTAAHDFIDRRTCKLLVDPSQCTFHFRLDGKERDVKVKQLVDSGFKSCPQNLSDWAVLKLEERVEEVTPYPVDERKISNLRKGDKLVAVASSHDFFVADPKTGKILDFPMHTSSCDIRDIFSNGVLGTTCGAGGGSSGGSCLDASGNYLIGVIRGGGESDAEENQAVWNGRPNKFHYETGKRGTICVPITGEFLKALNKAAPESTEL